MTKETLFKNNMKNFLEERFTRDDKEKNGKIVEKYLERWKTYRNSKAKNQECALRKLFDDYPKNDEFKYVLLKTSVLNDFYSTGIIDTYSVAKTILELRIDSMLEENNPDIVNKISEEVKRNTNRKAYSFSSKYCSFHKEEQFPIFDSRNEIILKYYKSEIKDFRKMDLNDYTSYVKVIKSYKEIFGLEKFSYKEIDRFNWTFCNVVCEKE